KNPTVSKPDPIPQNEPISIPELSPHESRSLSKIPSVINSVSKNESTDEFKKSRSRKWYLNDLLVLGFPWSGPILDRNYVRGSRTLNRIRAGYIFGMMLLLGIYLMHLLRKEILLV